MSAAAELRKLGISRVGDNDQALIVSFSRRPSDDEMRNIDAALDPGHQRFGEIKRERDLLRAALEMVLASASPNERDHPCMSAAWKAATKVLEAK